ncbi:LLM class flavin-dependent oxidoreductase [Nonomuraea aridisoli]|uniref:FAD-linked oxidase n=1 Tax=Nonomuraea aridisoli TaxID=2070368 RepID=A0A2W2EEJ3_9ACTN|nr:LLM class flavin-dependent oxidoreductase [Nonomuraea aridisoli]PZG22766.1 FAD-linked oxidase [Nonomuraea aridisoli]
MDYGHPLRFGVLLTPGEPAGPGALEDLMDLARLSEELGYDLVAFSGGPAQADPWTLASWAAGRTSRVRLLAAPAPDGNPAVLARAAASLDLLADGRVDLALAPARDAGAVGEAIDVIRGMWSASERSPLYVEGKHHRVAGADRGPAPARTVPLWIDGADPALLRLAGQKADGWTSPRALGTPPASPGDTAVEEAAGPEAAPAAAGLATEGPAADRSGADGAWLGELVAAQDVIDAAAAEAGRDPREIRRLARIAGRFTPARGGFLAGPPEKWIADLLPLVVDAGFATFVLEAGDPETLRRFAAEVVPALRTAVGRERRARGVVESAPARSAFVRSKRREGIDYDAVPASLAATAVEPGDAAYARVRSTYLRGGSPGLVLRPGTPAEVGEAIRFARTQPVKLSIRSGGHGISGRSTNNGGIVIDVSRLNTIEVLDKETRRVRIGPGARWSDVAAALAPYGWALSSGDYGGVGVGGLATAGGIGWLVREHGLTIDHMRAVEMVLADGSQVRADEHDNPELFWGVRGAGANFGIVTSFEFEVDEVGDVGFAQFVLDATDTADFLERWGAAMEAAPRDVTSAVILGRPRPGQPLIAQMMAVVDSDDADTIVSRLQPLAATAPLMDYSIQVLPYAAVMHVPPGTHDAQGEPVTRAALADHLTPELSAAAARLVRSGLTYFFHIRSVGGAASDVAPDATAYAGRSANFQLVAFGHNRRDLDPAWDALLPHFSGQYINFETDRRPERVREAYPGDTLRRLRALKRRYDPGKVFRDNFAIDPAEDDVTPGAAAG